MKAYDLKWSSGNKDALILRRLLRPRNQDNDIKEWIQTIKQKVERLYTFTEFVITTGLRKIECINSYNLIIALTETNKLNDYLIDNTLEHYRFHKTFLRNTKKAFISFVLTDLVKKVAKSPKISEDIIDKVLKRRHIPLRFSDIREYWATAMTRFLSQPEIDFLQGRVSSNTFMQHYFNPTLIHDLKERTLTGIKNLTIDNLDQPMLTQKSVSVT
jgi:intergrase/recombinase